jgi:glycosyltransferase involved in cell wall biosynthesis
MIPVPDTAVAEAQEPRCPRRDEVHISVVVPCHDEICHIRAFLDCVLGQDLGSIRMEVLIADGMSVDGTRRVLREYSGKFPAIHLVDNPEKVAAAGLNRAIREAQGEIILRMDAHTVYAPDYVRTCVAVLQETGADNVGGPALTRTDGYLAKAIACGFHSRFACGGAKFRDPIYEGPVRTVPYGCWRKSTLEAIGLFDPELVPPRNHGPRHAHFPKRRKVLSRGVYRGAVCEKNHAVKIAIRAEIFEEPHSAVGSGNSVSHGPRPGRAIRRMERRANRSGSPILDGIFLAKFLTGCPRKFSAPLRSRGPSIIPQSAMFHFSATESDPSHQNDELDKIPPFT